MSPPAWYLHLSHCAILLLLAGIVYSNSFQSGWVQDNRSIIQLDPRNKEASLENFKLIWGKDYWWPRSVTGAYRPIVSTTYWLNWSVFGSGSHATEADQVVGFHWLNLIAHGVNALLAYLLLLRLFRRETLAFFAAALFAVHPMATESVTNIIGRADEFLAMSFLGCTLLYIRSTESKSLKRRLLWLMGVGLLHGVGLFSKESAIPFLAIPLLYDAVYRWGSQEYSGPRKARLILADWLVYFALMLPLAGYLFVRSIVFRDTPAPALVFLDNPILRYSWSDANSLAVNLSHWILGRITACHAAGIALWKLIWPAHLSSDYSYNQIPLFDWQLSNTANLKALLAAAVVAGTLIVAAWCYRRHKAVTFLILFFWISNGSTSNFLVNASSIMGERFLYIPLVAFCGLMVLGIDALIRKNRILHGVLVVLVILYGARTYQRNFDWKNDLALAKSAIAASPQSFRSYQVLAFAYYGLDPAGRIDQIIQLAETGMKILDPLPDSESNSRLYLDLGIYYGIKGEQAATRNPDGSLSMNDNTRGWYQRSLQVLERGRAIDRAANETNQTRQLKRGRTNIPDIGTPALYMYLGMAYAGLEMDDKAIEAFRYMRHLDPRDPEAYARIGASQVAKGQLEEAAISFLQCVTLAPQRNDVWQQLIQLYSQINREPVPAVEVVVVNNVGQPRLREDNKMLQQHLLRARSELSREALR